MNRTISLAVIASAFVAAAFRSHSDVYRTANPNSSIEPNRFYTLPNADATNNFRSWPVVSTGVALYVATKRVVYNLMAAVQGMSNKVEKVEVDGAPMPQFNTSVPSPKIRLHDAKVWEKKIFRGFTDGAGNTNSRQLAIAGVSSA